MRKLLEDNFGFVFEDNLIEEMSGVGILKNIPEGNLLIDIGNAITYMPLLIKGALKILREDDNGDELLLYFIERGDTCAMTLSCCFGTAKSKVRAIAETNTELILIPIDKMESWMEKYASWRSFILESYHVRMMELIDAIDTLAFLKMNERLLKHLQDKAKVLGNDIISSTHQDIAYDLHTSRVVISRLLKGLEKEGKIEMQRNNIKVIDL